MRAEKRFVRDSAGCGRMNSAIENPFVRNSIPIYGRMNSSAPKQRQDLNSSFSYLETTERRKRTSREEAA
jgi:hypothetical protein